MRHIWDTLESWVTNDFWTLFNIGLTILFVLLLATFVAMSGCDAPPDCCDGQQLCGPDYDYTACNTKFVPLPYPVPLPKTTVPSGGTDAGVDVEECIPDDTPASCDEYCLTNFGQCVSRCIKTVGNNKYAFCVKYCRKQQA